MTQPQAGWYPDPSGDSSKLRYWDGTQWTNDVSNVQPVQATVNNSDQTLYLIAFIFCLLSTISVGWVIIPLIWMIPMTVHCWRIYKGVRPNTIAFGVCTLIFLSVIGGIFLLVSRKN